MPGEVFRLRTDDLAKPISDLGATDAVAVDPARPLSRVVALVDAGVVRRVDVDALHLTGVIRQQCLERDEVVALDDEVPLARLTATKRLDVLQ